MIVLAGMQQSMGLGVLVALLVLTEWLDGFLARRWHQESAAGARLDTVADAVFYSSLLVAIPLLRPALIWREANWIAAAVVSYVLSWLASWLKFGRLPSYHTWAAKAAWGAVAVGLLTLLAGWAAWPFQAAMALVTLTNVEAILITRALNACQVDVPSLWHARRFQE